MPQFELKDGNSDGISVVRSRNKENAARDFFNLTAETVVSFRESNSLEGWEHIEVDGRHLGQIRPFHRMKFRRD